MQAAIKDWYSPAIEQNFMGKIVEDRFWGFGLKLAIAMVPVTASSILAAFIYLYATINRHSNQLEGMSEWRKATQDVALSAAHRLEILEREERTLNAELAVMKANIEALTALANTTSAQMQQIIGQMMDNQHKLDTIARSLENAKSK